MKNVQEKFDALVDKMQLFDLYTMNPRDEVAIALDELKEAIQQIPETKEYSFSDIKTEMVERLSRLISDDDERYESTEKALELLMAQAEIDGTVMADDIVLMWEQVEYEFTVDELINEISN